MTQDEKFLRMLNIEPCRIAEPESLHRGCQERWIEERDAKDRAELQAISANCAARAWCEDSKRLNRRLTWAYMAIGLLAAVMIVMGVILWRK